MTIITKPFDAAKHLTDEADQIDLINDALHEGNPRYIASAIGTVLRARGMSAVASAAGLNRQSLHKAFSNEGNPTLNTVLKVLDELGIELQAKPKAERRPEHA